MMIRRRVRIIMMIRRKVSDYDEHEEENMDDYAKDA